MKIPLRARDGTIRDYAIVDETDYPRLNAYNWYLHKLGYAARRELRSERPRGGRRGQVYLHREVLGLTRKDPNVADHINRNPLDCRRENLRPIPRGINSFANIQRWENERQGSPPIDAGGDDYGS